jgi:tRNA pseudouridine38-40 synthase
MRAFRVAYDGTDYRGFQRQPHGETVEDAFFDALRDLGVGFEDGSPVGYAAAGRTDAGVSARAQTVAFETPTWLSPAALNSELPASIRAWAAADVPESFHATHDAAERAYRYFLYAPGADDDLAERAATRLSGAHDFHNFTPDDERTERELSVSLQRDGAFLVVDCRAGGFARQLVRRLVSVLDAVAREERPLEFIDRALAPVPLSGPEGIGSAAPEPLVLVGVRYPGIEFRVDDRALAAVREVFDRRRRRRLAGARVAGELFAVDPSE